MKTDTIAAIATSLSDAGIGIIRVSGENAIEICDKIFQTPNGRHILKDVKSHTIHYGFIVENREGEVYSDSSSDLEKIDEVMLSVMRAPKSFTTEDTVEINCHGGILVLKKVLELVCKNGARLAEPGEFTKRAFLNGRIDLTRAEAVMDFIHSQNEYALKASFGQLQGKLSEQIKQLRKDILYELAFIESALDDPEHISLDGYPETLFVKLVKISKEIKDLSDTFTNGKMIKDGISTVILGKPNVGKSSLMNLLLGEERAIVTDIAGTTRDTLQEAVNLNGIHLNLVDTAGIRDTDDKVEKIGVERAKRYAENADLILYVIDTSNKLEASDIEIINFLNSFHDTNKKNNLNYLNKKVIILLNKNDLDPVITEKDIQKEFENQGLNCDIYNRNFVIVKTSTKDGTGMDNLEAAVEDMFLSGMLKNNDEVIVTNFRHKEALLDAYESLSFVLKSIEDGMPEDFYSIDMMDAYKALGRIIGEEVEDDLVEEIFSKFCMGK